MKFSQYLHSFFANSLWRKLSFLLLLCTKLHWQPYIEAHFKGFLAVFCHFGYFMKKIVFFVLLCTALHWQPYVEAHFKGWRGHTMWIHDVLCTAQNQDWLLCTYYTIQHNWLNYFLKNHINFSVLAFSRDYFETITILNKIVQVTVLDLQRCYELCLTPLALGRHYNYVTSKSVSGLYGTYSVQQFQFTVPCIRWEFLEPPNPITVLRKYQNWRSFLIKHKIIKKGNVISVSISPHCATAATLPLRWSENAQLKQARLPYTVGLNWKNPPKIILKDFWNLQIIFVPSAIWQILNM